ncbi:DUF6550 family protein [Neglectibacter timonensis]|uniref:DUF6550 family protein n=1 Tax=Neglectibacter timonensis TaxID=1776382 RepID=UPI003991CBAC
MPLCGRSQPGGTTRPNTNARRSCPENGCCDNEKENTQTPRAEPDEELGAVLSPHGRATPAVETPQPEPAPPTPQPTIELQPGDEVYIPGFGWVPYEGPNHREYAADMYENGNKIGSMG